MAGFNLMAGNAAGGGADALMSLLKQKALEFAQSQQHDIEAQRNQIAQQSANDNTAYRMADLKSRDETRATAADQALAGQGMRMGAVIPRGTDVAGQPDVVKALTAAGLAPEHKDPTLASTALSGIVNNGNVGPGLDAPRLPILSRTVNAGHGAQEIYQGSEPQRQADQARTDKLAATEQSRQDKIDAAGQGKTDKEDLIRLTASLRPSPQAPLVMVQTVDADGNPVTKMVKKEAGAEYLKPANATTANRVASAESVNKVGNDIVAKLSDPKYAAVVGPLMGRASKLQDLIGNPPPEFAELAGEIESYALANMGVHGMRSAQGAEQIKHLLEGKHTPESLIAAVKGLQNFSNTFVAGNKPKSGGGAQSSIAGSVGPAPKVIKYDMNGNPIKD